MNAVLKPLPACLAAAPTVLVAYTTGPDGMRLRVGPKRIDLTDPLFEHLVAVAAGAPDPDWPEYDFVHHNSALGEAVNLRASISRIRKRLVAGFAGEPDAALAWHVIDMPGRRTYQLHPTLTVRVCPSVRRIPRKVVRPEILDKLIARYGVESDCPRRDEGVNNAVLPAPKCGPQTSIPSRPLHLERDR